MKIYNSPYYDYASGLNIMILDDPSEDGREVYYRKPGYPYIFAFGLSRSVDMFTTIQYARANASVYLEVLFR